MEKPKPCPFCGSEAAIQEMWSDCGKKPYAYQVICSSDTWCGIDIMADKEEDAILNWNKRVYEKENAVLRAEVERLNELLWGSRCVYCGEVVGKDRKNQDIADEVLREHVLICEKHPAFKLRADLAAAVEVLRYFLAWNDGNIHNTDAPSRARALLARLEVGKG